MKNFLSLLLSFLICISTYSQVAPQKGFTDKLASDEMLATAAFQKLPATYNGSNYDLKYHRFFWNIDPDTLFISGEVTSYFVPTEPDIPSVTFDFTILMTVDSVLYHSSLMPFTQTTDDELIIGLPYLLPEGLLDSVSIFYHGSPPQGSGFGSFRKDIHSATGIIWTLSEPFGAKEWWPCKNDLSDKIDSIDVYVSTPDLYRASSNGMLISETQAGNTRTAHWKHRYPIAAYLIAVAVTNYQSFSVYAHPLNDSIEILNYVYPETFANAQTDVLAVINSMELFDSLFIPYPFINERYGHTQFNWAGGMEHQTNTFIYGFWHELMAHELAHQWVGDMITCGDWHDIWLNEGFATYWTGLTYNYLFNGYYWPLWKRYQIDDIVSQPDGSVYCTDTTNVGRIFDGRLSYQKGAMLLHMLRWVIGDSAFYTGMKSYLTDASLAYAYACSDDFITHMETAADTSLTEFFNDWLYGEGHPEYSISCFFSMIPGDLQFTINQTQSHASVSYFEMPVPIEFKNATQDTIVVFDNFYSGQVYNLNIGFFPDSVKFDPELWLVATLDTLLILPSFLPEHNAADFCVYPNPASDVLYIKKNGMQIQEYCLYDICGLKVLEIKPDVSPEEIIEIPTGSLLNGIYLLKIRTGDYETVRKITKF